MVLASTAYIYSMEEQEEPTEKTGLLAKLKNYLGYNSDVSIDTITLAEMPSEVKGMIFDFLPGNNRGLNYLIRLNSFYPSDKVFAKVETAFVEHLCKHRDPTSEEFGYQMIHFFEHTQYGSESNKLYSFSKDVRSLNQLMVGPSGIPFLRRNDYTANTDLVDRVLIEKKLKKFYKRTPTKWNELSAGSKVAITRSDFYAIRMGILEYFKKRLESYEVEKNCSCARVPGCLCCLCGCCSIGVGTAVACLVDENLGVAIAIIGGISTFVCGGMGCLCLPYIVEEWRGEPGREFYKQHTYSSDDQKKVEDIIQVITSQKNKLYDDLAQLAEDKDSNEQGFQEIVDISEVIE